MTGIRSYHARVCLHDSHFERPLIVSSRESRSASTLRNDPKNNPQINRYMYMKSILFIIRIL
jgi:hypothetical protein